MRQDAEPLNINGKNMSRPTSSKSAAPRKNGSPMLMGILLGMVFGVALAAVLAWYLLKSPSPFVNKVQEVVKAEVVKAEVAVPEVVVHKSEVAPKVESAANAASGVGEVKPRFEFYKVLSDKQDATTTDKPKAADKPKEGTPPAAFQTSYLQAGSFANSEEAENLKASLAMKGVESSVQTVNLPEKGVWHRVRVGPFKTEKEMNTAMETLKRNGLNATPTH